MGALAVFNDRVCELGEAPLWCADADALYWVDAFVGRIHRAGVAAAAADEWPTPSCVAALALHSSGGIVAGLKSGIHVLDVVTGALAFALDPEHDLPGNRYNDCTVDARGRLWIGSLDDTGVAGRGSLYRIAPDGAWTTMVAGVSLSNGLGFSPDQRRLYHTDTAAQAIFAYDWDLETGTLGPRALFAADDDCAPDGLAVDVEGGVWSAKWNGGRVVRYLPDGTVDRVIELPVANPTSVAFGGPGFDRLFITTASIESGPDDLRNGAGLVFVHEDPGTVGQPPRRCELELPGRG
jgi:sugar lactone lactonase YvrE